MVLLRWSATSATAAEHPAIASTDHLKRLFYVLPVFEEVLDAVRSPLQAEIKDVAAARALAEVMLRRDLVGRVEVSSFHDEAIAEIDRLVPGRARPR